MDKEIVYIYNILSQEDNRLTTSEISKKLYEKYQIKVSRKIVQNYMWSYFRSIIDYDSSDYTYKLDTDEFLIEDISVESVSNSPRAVSTEIKGSKIKIGYDRSKPIEVYIKALALLNFRSSRKIKNADLIKLLNRIIEQIELLDD